MSWSCPSLSSASASASSLVNVKYICACGKREEITKLLYFCRHCAELRCGSCVSEEIDSHFCPNCQMTVPSGEAKIYHNKCTKCVDCPMCSSSLTVSSLPTVNKEAHPMLFLSCSFCCWTSLKVGITEALPDLLLTRCLERERSHKSAISIPIMIERYRKIAHDEWKESETRRLVAQSSTAPWTMMGSSSNLTKSKGSMQSLTERIASASSLSLISGGFSDRVDSEDSLADTSLVKPLTEYSPAPDELYSSDFRIDRYATVKQRYSNSGHDAVYTEQLLPQRKQLLSKRSKRCVTCSHNLIKPELNPLIKFKIHLVALLFVPKLTVFSTSAPLAVGASSSVLFRISNPLPNDIDIKLRMCVNENIQLKLPSDSIKIAGNTFIDVDEKEESILSADLVAMESPCIVQQHLNTILLCVPIYVIRESEPGFITIPLGFHYSYERSTVSGVSSSIAEVDFSVDVCLPVGLKL